MLEDCLSKQKRSLQKLVDIAKDEGVQLRLGLCRLVSIGLEVLGRFLSHSQLMHGL
jgi:hypothetical protein